MQAGNESCSAYILPLLSMKGVRGTQTLQKYDWHIDRAMNRASMPLARASTFRSAKDLGVLHGAEVAMWSS